MIFVVVDSVVFFRKEGIKLCLYFVESVAKDKNIYGLNVFNKNVNCKINDEVTQTHSHFLVFVSLLIYVPVIIRFCFT